MKIGPYEVLGEVGRGGMGTVHHGRSPSGDEVAIKVLARATPDARARFERERRLLAELGLGEGFVPLLDGGVEGETPFLVMPFVPGGTLRRKLQGVPLGVDETVGLGIALALALGRAHAKGIVHRDLKPENILFTAEGVPLIADLGLAKHFRVDAASVSLSKPGAMRGTWGYMPREQMQDAKTVDARADVFALGAILHECLAGEPAFPGDAPEAMAKIASGYVPSLARHDAPPWLAQVIERALAPDPARRFASGADLALALRRSEPASRSRAGLVFAGLGAAVLLALVLRGRAASPKGDAIAAAVSSARPVSRSLAAREAALRGQKELLAGQVDPAIASLTSAIELDPSLATAWLDRGEAKRRKLDPQGAFDDCSRAIDLDPKLARAWAERAIVRFLRGDFDGMYDDASRSLELDPKLALGYAARAGARWYRSRDTDAMIADASEAIKLDPTLGIGWAARGAARVRQGDLVRGLADADRAVEVAPSEAYTWTVRGSIHIWMEHADLALADLERSLQIDPTSAGTYAMRGQAWDLKGDAAHAIPDLERGLAMGLPDEAYAQLVRDLLGELKAGRRKRRH